MDQARPLNRSTLVVTLWHLHLELICGDRNVNSFHLGALMLLKDAELRAVCVAFSAMCVMVRGGFCWISAATFLKVVDRGFFPVCYLINIHN